ncbi:Hypothetical predicted protein, partial [Marmota monax]
PDSVTAGVLRATTLFYQALHLALRPQVHGPPKDTGHQALEGQPLFLNRVDSVATWLTSTWPTTPRPIGTGYLRVAKTSSNRVLSTIDDSPNHKVKQQKTPPEGTRKAGKWKGCGHKAPPSALRRSGSGPA